MKKKKQSKSEETNDLRESIDNLEEQLEKVNSIKSVFFKGVLGGLGSVIGATIVFAIIISILSWFVTNTEIGWVNRVIEVLGLSQVFNK
jgi:uncharacterized membrane protein YcjF (UPF0283 family)